VAGTLETFAKIASETGAYRSDRHGCLRFTLPAERFFSPFHRSAAGCYRHGTIEGAGTAVFAKFGFLGERELDAAVFCPSDKSYGIGMPHFRTITHTASTLNTIIVSEGVTDFLYTTADSNILDRLGIGSLCNNQFRDIAA
jgi:hypothetical protein